MDKTVFHRVRAINNSVAFDLGVCRTDNTNMFAESYFEGNHIHAINMTDNSRPLIVASRMLDNGWASSPPSTMCCAAARRTAKTTPATISSCTRRGASGGSGLVRLRISRRIGLLKLGAGS